MTITPFGWIFLLFAALVLGIKREWLLALLPSAAVLHAPAVIVAELPGSTSRIGVSPWQTLSLIVAIALLREMPACFRGFRTIDQEARWLLGGWSLFFLVSSISAIVMPLLFAGFPTYNNQVIESLAAGTQPLEFRLGNLAQAVNYVLIWVVLIYGLIATQQKKLDSLLLNSMVVAGVISVALSITQRMLLLAGLEPSEVAASSLNPGYGHHLGYLFARDGIRVGWPFSEPSYASVWFGALAVSGSVLWLWLRLRRGALLLLLGLVGLLNSFSGSGVAAAIFVGSIALMAAFTVRKEAAGARSIRIRAIQLCGVGFLGILLLAAFATFVELSHPNVGSVSALEAAVTFMREKINDHRSEDPGRWVSNLHALSLLAETYGLGVGLGSNRASSLIANLLSNLGVIPSALFIGLNALQLLLIWRREDKSAHVIALPWAMSTVMVGATLGIPDLAWPVLWLFVLLTFWSACRNTRISLLPAMQSKE